MPEKSVIVAYSEVHQAFQIAQAAEEEGLLERFYGSVFDAPGKLGHSLQRWIGSEALANRRCREITSDGLREIPWPFLVHRLASLSSRTKNLYPWYRANFDFDHAVAREIRKSAASVFVGTETCARDSLVAAGERGMRKVLDCPQVHPLILTRLLETAADDLKVAAPPPFDPPELAARKAEEFAMSDRLLVLSEVHHRSFIEAGFSPDRLVQIPLWVDPELWFPPSQNPREPDSGEGLRVLFVGNVGLRKGVPYLLQAIEKCDERVELSLAGVNSGEADPFLRNTKRRLHFLGRKNKAELRETYWDADVLVLPSLVDTFGFVALEAMACGLPVIISDNCGVPVPGPDWRVPIMNSDAIAKRLEYYRSNPEELQTDGEIAAEFARQYTPTRYRSEIAKLLKSLLR